MRCRKYLVKAASDSVKYSAESERPLSPEAPELRSPLALFEKCAAPASMRDEESDIRAEEEDAREPRRTAIFGSLPHMQS